MFVSPEAKPQELAQSPSNDDADIFRRQIASINSLPDAEKVALLEDLHDLPEQKDLFVEALSHINMTDAFVKALASYCLDGSPIRPPRDPGAYKEMTWVREVAISVVEMFDLERKLAGKEAPPLSTLSSEVKASLIVFLLLGGDAGLMPTGREILASSIQLNTKLYEQLRTSIVMQQFHTVEETVARAHVVTVADFINGFSAEQLATLDDFGWMRLYRILTRVDIDSTAPTTSWIDARKEVFERMPISPALMNADRQLGFQFIDKVLEKPKLTEKATEFLRLWKDHSDNVSVEALKDFFEELAIVAAEVYNTDVPEICISDDCNETYHPDGKISYDNGWYSGPYIITLWKDGPKGWAPRWTNSITLTQRGTLSRPFNAVLQTFFHEFGHMRQLRLSASVDSSLALSYVDNGFKEIEKTTVRSPLFPAATIFSHSTGSYGPGSFYVRPDEHFPAYLAQPREKHAEWFGTLLENNFNIVMNEALNEGTPGPLAEGLTQHLHMLVTEAERPHGRLSRFLKKRILLQKAFDAQRHIDALNNTTSFSLEYLEDLKGFLESHKIETPPYLDQYIDYKRYREAQDELTMNRKNEPNAPTRGNSAFAHTPGMI